MTVEEQGSGHGTPEEAASRPALQQQLDWAHRNTRQLLDETARYRTENRDLQAAVQRHEAEYQRMTGLLARAEHLVRSMDQGLQQLRRSLSLQLGYTILTSLRSLRGMAALPVRLVRLARSARGGTQAVHVPLPHEWFPPALRRELEHFRSDFVVLDHEEGALAPRTRVFASLPDALADVRIAAIMDEFTFSSYREVCQVQQLTPSGWAQELDACKPHLLFIESAWDGKDSAWQRKISGTATELRELVAHCRRSAIPVVFWSKEDPVHFKTFLATARLADVVFTTDIDCIGHYKTELGHDRVFLLPFAAQPRAHHPLERYERKAGFCFAGSYYVRYPVRQRDFASLIGAVSKRGEVDIYDRNHGKEHPNYIFPEDYRRYIIGNLSFDQIDLAYKGYEFGININTVKHSQSMFARRVYDLLASNTTVVSNYSRGLRLMFGDLVVSSDDGEQLGRRLDPLVHDPLLRRKHRLAGLRKVMREHTYQHRLGYVLQKVYERAPAVSGPDIVVLARIASADSLQRVLAGFHRQAWASKRLVLCFEDGFRPVRSPVAADVQVLSAAQAQARRIETLAAGGYVAGFHSADYYGPHYLTDLALATQYSPSPVIGKAAHYGLHDGAPQLVGDGAQYRLATAISRRRGMCRADDCADTVADWMDGIASAEWPGGLAVDEFNYCADAGAQSSCRIVDDVPGLDEGLPVSALLSLAERVGASDERRQRDACATIPGLSAAELLAGLGTPANRYLALGDEDGVVVLRSTLPMGQHAYAYLEDTFTTKQLHCSDVARMHLVSEGGDGLGLVLVYLDENGTKISHALVKSAANVTAAVPPGTHAVQMGLRVPGPGEFRIHRLALDHVPLAVDTIVARGRHLLVAKNYPSHGDLYKHAFVHRRVVEYRRALGTAVDVFRVGGDGLRFYEFDGVDVIHGGADHLRALLGAGGYDTILVHVLDERTWEVLREFVDRYRVIVWAHGSEIQSASRREFDHPDPASRARAIALGDRRMALWRGIFREAHPNFTMVFVSAWSAADAMDDIGEQLPAGSFDVIHNFIDGDLFAYLPKDPAQRMKILTVRPFTSNVYANDLAVAAILQLSNRPFFDQLEFRLIGDGPLFDSTVSPVRGLPNVIIEQRFLTQAELAQLHRDYGVFLVPTRMDSQGVSRDEAMASGLVPVTNRVAAIPEFVDDTCGMLADPEDASGLADAIERLYRDPALFQRLSEAAAGRVRAQRGYAATIAREIELFDGAGNRR